MSNANVASVLAPAVTEAGLVLEDVSVTTVGKRRVVRVTVDLPPDEVGSLPLDDIAQVSRAVSDALDAKDVLGGAPYVLEVSSPGVERPLTEVRHWRRARTRLVKVPVDGATLTARVLEADDEALRLDVDGQERTIPWASVGTGRVQVEFNRAEQDDEQDGMES